MHRPKGSTAAEMQENALDATSKTDEGDWLLKERFKAKGVLFESQKRAGLSMHYDKRYSDVSGVPAENTPDWLRTGSKGGLDSYAWRLYTDGTWEIGDVTTDAGLKDALRQIEAAGDSSLVGTSDYRSANQRDYLANKAYVR